MLAEGQIVQERDNGFVVFVPCINHKEAIRRANSIVTVEFDDGRGITAKQRRKAYVLLGYIAEWAGYTPLETLKELTKFMFLGTGYTCKNEMLSLADCDRTTARLYITFLIDFCIMHHIECGEPLYKLCEDIPRYIYACAMNKACCVCGRKSEIHHTTGGTIGMGRNRKEIPQIGLPFLPLCRKHHIACHSIGNMEFTKQYMLDPIPLTEEIMLQYKTFTRKNYQAIK